MADCYAKGQEHTIPALCWRTWAWSLSPESEEEEEKEEERRPEHRCCLGNLRPELTLWIFLAMSGARLSCIIFRSPPLPRRPKGPSSPHRCVVPHSCIRVLTLIKALRSDCKRSSELGNSSRAQGTGLLGVSQTDRSMVAPSVPLAPQHATLLCLLATEPASVPCVAASQTQKTLQAAHMALVSSFVGADMTHGREISVLH